MSEVCLTIIFNHKFNRNIPLIEKIYKNRFSSIFYIVPFFDEHLEGIDNDRVIPVYETSYCFQGYIAQAYSRLKSERYTHYVFIGDDQLLNPCLNEDNIIEEMGLSNQDSYIKEIVPYDEIRNGSLVDKSDKLYNILSAFNINVGVSYLSEIPTYKKAVEQCEKHGLRVAKRLPFAFFLNKGYLYPKYLPLTLVALGINKGRRLRYPLFKAYSDMVIIDQGSFKEFCRLSGVFAAMNIFVETAIPLAMVLSCKNIKYEKDISRFHGVEWWGKDIERSEKKYKCDLSILLSKFERDVLYYHPIKLSKWKSVEMI